MRSIIKSGAFYFFGYCISLLLDLMALLKLNDTVSSVASFISLSIKIPITFINNVFDSIIPGVVVIVLCGICFILELRNIINDRKASFI